MNNLLPLVSIVIPCRNEEKFISQCLDSLINQDYPKDKLEILVIDGASTDRTKDVISSYLQKYKFIKLFENSRKTTPISMNIGIKNALGEIVTKTDAHTIYPKDYISKSIKYMSEYKADCVGGIAKATPKIDSLSAKAISLSLSSKFGSGSSFRTGVKKPQWADTAFGCFYKKEVFKKIGLYNENLIRSQDMEFNLRLKKAGGKILLVPDIVTYYYPKSTLKEFFKHNFTDGIWAFYPLKFKVPLFKLRHLLPFFFILTLLVSGFISIFFKPFFFIFLSILGLYLIASLFFSLSIAIREKNLGLFFVLPLAFACRHFGYGLGSIFGFVKILLPIKK